MFQSSRHAPSSINAFRKRCTFSFDNEFGASVIKQRGTSGLFEVAVLDLDGNIVNDRSDGPNGVYGHVTASQVDEILDLVSAI